MSIKEELFNYGFNFNKNFGQNFITDNNLLNAICNDAQVTNQSTVLEIGTGAGTLTYALSQHANQVISFEIDKNLTQYLTDKFKNVSNTEIIFCDFLKYDKEKLSQKFSNQEIKVVANLPYYITTPLIFDLLQSNLNIQSLTLMVQKEVAERIVAKPNTKDYGALSVAIQSQANASITRIVPRNMFTPAPKVDSAIIHIQLQDLYNVKNKKTLNNTIKACFFSRRKTLINNLSAYFSVSKSQTEKILKTLGVETNIRGEQLSVEQIIKLSEIIDNQIYTK